MASVKDLHRRINSLKNMQKVMSAMNMIASIRMHKLVSRHAAMKLYDEAIDAFSRETALLHSDNTHPVRLGNPSARLVHAVLFTADKGLNGAHNQNAQKAAEALVNHFATEETAVEFSCIGAKGAAFCRRRGFTTTYQSAISEKDMDQTSPFRFLDSLLRRFLAGELQRIIVIYNQYFSTIHQETVSSSVLPLAFPPAAGRASYSEPESAEMFLDAAAGRILAARVKSALAHSRLSEQAARMTAMENATHNAEDLVDRYAAMRNRARQASITREIIEIIAGKEALNE
jgi:F-type H+-transporting ATPase subunit gamma